MIKNRFSLPGGRPAGQAMPEFALVASFFFLLLFGIIEMGIVVYRYNTVSAAAREAARYAMVHNPTSLNPASTDQIAAVAISYAPFLSAAEVTVTFSSRSYRSHAERCAGQHLPQLHATNSVHVCGAAHTDQQLTDARLAVGRWLA